jgi:hypothetical protein
MMTSAGAWLLTCRLATLAIQFQEDPLLGLVDLGRFELPTPGLQTMGFWGIEPLQPDHFISPIFPLCGAPQSWEEVEAKSAGSGNFPSFSATRGYPAGPRIERLGFQGDLH